MTSKFKVETYANAVSGYDTDAVYSPDYVLTVMKFPRGMFIRWPKKEIGVIMNLREAEQHAFERAVHHAKIIHRKSRTPVQILRETEMGGKKVKAVVWKDGKLLDRGYAPWYWRWWYAKNKEAGPRS